MMSDEDMRERANSHKLSTPNISSINKKIDDVVAAKETTDDNSICGSCLRKKSQDMSVNGEEPKAASVQQRKKIEVIQKDTSDSESSILASTDDGSDCDSIDQEEKEVNDGQAEFKLNRQRWKYYKRIQQANRTKARRPRYFSLNVLMDKIVGQSTKTTLQKPTVYHKSNEHSMTSSQSHSTKPSLIEKQRTRITLVLSNLDLKKRQLEDKYEVNSGTSLLDAENYANSKTLTQPHSCVIKNKQRSSSLSCLECWSLHDSFHSEFTKEKIYKKRNSLFGPKHTEDLLSALPR